MASPSRPWLGVGVALSALPAAASCFCLALLLAVIAGSDPAPVLLMALVVAGVPFALPGGLFLPGARRFAAAWKLLDPSLQARFGGFAAWRSGYKYTVANSPGSLQVTAGGGAATVGLTLRAGDRDACGKTVEHRFAVSWRLARTEAGWRATAAEARTLSGAHPAAAC